MKNIKLNVYGDDGKTVVKTLSGTEYDLTFGTIRKLMALLKIDKANNTLDLLARINDAWDDITKILDNIFEEATEEDWAHVKVKELLPVIVSIVKYSLAQALTIPTEKN